MQILKSFFKFPQQFQNESHFQADNKKHFLDKRKMCTFINIYHWEAYHEKESDNVIIS